VLVAIAKFLTTGFTDKDAFGHWGCHGAAGATGLEHTTLQSCGYDKQGCLLEIYQGCLPKWWLGYE
jgi:hypothetical protein